MAILLLSRSARLRCPGINDLVTNWEKLLGNRLRLTGRGTTGEATFKVTGEPNLSSTTEIAQGRYMLTVEEGTLEMELVDDVVLPLPLQLVCCKIQLPGWLCRGTS